MKSKSLGILLVFLCFIATPSILAQSNFLKTYNFIGFQGVNSIAQVENHAFVMVGEGQTDVNGYEYTFVVKTDVHGNIIWKKFLGDPNGLNNGSQIINTPSGYVILGSAVNTTVHILDQDGNVLSKVVQTDSLWYAAAMDLTSDGGLIMAAEKPQSNVLLNDIVLVKTDLTGVILWRKQYGVPEENERPFKILQLSDGGALVVGITTETSEYPFYENILIFRTDIAGNVVWRKILGGVEQNVPVSLIATKGGDYMIASYNNGVPGLLQVTKINENGTVLWDKAVNGTMIGSPRAAVGADDGGFIIIGERLFPYINPPEPPRSTLLWGISENGDLLWQREYVIDPRYSAGYAITMTDDGNFLAGGRVTNGTDVDFFLLKIGLDGCQINNPDLGQDSTWCNVPIILDAGNDYDIYQWSTGQNSPRIEVSSSGSYWVKAETFDGCSRTDTVQVNVKDCFLLDNCKKIVYSADEVMVPNIITPNGDGKNDFLEFPQALIRSRLSIFNRWGSEVYVNQHFDNSWSGAELSDGIYFYAISNECLSKTLRGPLTIVK